MSVQLVNDARRIAFYMEDDLHGIKQLAQAIFLIAELVRLQARFLRDDRITTRQSHQTNTPRPALFVCCLLSLGGISKGEPAMGWGTPKICSPSGSQRSFPQI